MEIEILDPSEVDRHTLATLRRLTLEMHSSGLKNVLNVASGRPCNYWRFGDLGKFVVAKDHDKILGWGVAPQVVGFCTNRCLMIYVGKNFRQKGVGSKIAKKLRQRYPNTTCRKWNGEARAFYDSLGM